MNDILFVIVVPYILFGITLGFFYLGCALANLWKFFCQLFRFRKDR